MSCSRWEERPTTVVNVKRESCDVLVDRTTIFGNPFTEWKYGREDCIKRHRKYFYDRLERDLAFKTSVLGLRGLRIGCHCKPLPCHADTIAEYINTYSQVEAARIQAALEDIMNRINRLATEHGWYEEELQGEVLAAISGIDNPVLNTIKDAADADHEYDVIGAVSAYLQYLKKEVESGKGESGDG